MIWALRNFFFRLLRPSFWIQSCPTDKKWDLLVQELLNKEISEIDQYTCTIGGVTLWIENYPYASGFLWPEGVRVLPQPITRKRLQEKIIDHHIKSFYKISGSPE